MGSRNAPCPRFISRQGSDFRDTVFVEGRDSGVRAMLPCDTATGAVKGVSSVMIAIGNHEFAFVSDVKCAVCRSDHRAAVENLLWRGQAPVLLIDLLTRLHGESAITFTREDIIAHLFKQHAPISIAQEQIMLARKADELVQNIWEGQNAMDMQLAVIDSTINAAFDNLRDFNYRDQVTLGEAFKAMMLHAQLYGETNDNALTVQVVSMAFAEYMRTAEKLMPRESFQLLAEKLAKNPVLHALNKKVLSEGRPGDIEMEIVEARAKLDAEYAQPSLDTGSKEEENDDPDEFMTGKPYL